MRFAIATLGCKVNHYDSAVIEDRLSSVGLERGEFDQVADVYVINTCTVTDRADTESLKLARRARRLNPKARIVMTGCLAQANPSVLAAAPQVDRVIGLARLDDLTSAALGGDGERVLVSNLRKEKAEIAVGPASLAGQTRAFLRLQEGCDQFCTFCVIPFSRGSSRSVPPRQVMAALPCPIVLLTSHADPDVAARAVDAGVLGFLVKPLRPAELAPALDVAVSRFRDLEAARMENEALRRKLESRKLVDRAKGLLMTRLGMSEPEAFRRIQKTAMDTRRTMAEVAQALLLTDGMGPLRPAR